MISSYEQDRRIVLTLDAGGTNFVFSAIGGGREVAEPVRLNAHADNLDLCLAGIVEGFGRILPQLPGKPVAISFAFPGPADYANGVICRPPNFPAFSQGDIPLGPFLEATFGIPVFIHNDGALFAYGEALCGRLPEINDALRSAGSDRRYGNLLGITFGTGFGGGAVVDGRLLRGDNDTGGNVWVFRNKKYADLIAEESVSIRAVVRVYEELSGCRDETRTPFDVFEIAEGRRPGDRLSAVEAFRELGQIAGDVIAQANTLIDGLVVIGGGLSGAAKYYMDALTDEINGTIGTFGGIRFPRSQSRAYNLDDPEQLQRFLAVRPGTAKIPNSDREVVFIREKVTGVITSKLGANRAVSLGSYAYALSQLDK